MAIAEVLKRFEGKKILIIGDVMLDKYFDGEVSRISPEAPVPVVNVKKEYYELGGAGNVASNISSLKGNVSLFGFVGKDKEGGILRNLLIHKHIHHFFDESEVTIQKMRIVGRGQQLIRFDKEESSEKSFSKKTKEELMKQAKEAGVIIISDYSKGTITKDLMSLLEPFKNKIIVDPKPNHKELYKNVFAMTPNEKEALELSSCSNALDAGNKLKKELNSNILITRGENGMMLFSDKITDIPTYAKEVYDVSGAGDTVIAAFAMAIASRASLEEAAIISNHAASISVSKKGTYSVSLEELKRKILSEEDKIVSFDELKKIVSDGRRKGKKIVWTNGYFDGINIEHVRFFQEAKKLGDIFIVGLNEKSQKKLIHSEKERAEILSSIELIDYVLPFSENSVERYLNELKPDVYVKGSSYSLDSMNGEEKKAVEAYHGKIIFIGNGRAENTKSRPSGK